MPSLLCCNHVSYCLFESASRPEQENFMRFMISFFLQELWLLISSRARSRVLCRVSSKYKNWNFQMKKSSRRIIFVYTIVSCGATFCCRFRFDFYELLTLSWPDFPQLFAVYRKTILLIDQSNHLHSYYI